MTTALSWRRSLLSASVTPRAMLAGVSLPEGPPKPDRPKGRGETKRSQLQHRVDETRTLDRKFIYERRTLK